MKKLTSFLFAVLAVVAVSCEKPEANGDNGDNGDNPGGEQPTEVAITSLAFSEGEKEYELAATTAPIDLMSMLIVKPEGYTETVVFESSDAEAVSVTADGKMNVNKLTPGVTVTAKAAGNADIKATFTVKVYKMGKGAVDYDRSAWTMTCSQDPLPTTPTKNSLTAMLDDDMPEASNFGVVRPGKKSGGVNLADADKENHEISFTIDMKTAQKVDYFNIKHISTKTTDFGTRFAKFSSIHGSNDGEAFTEIEGLVDFTEQSNVQENQMTGNVIITESEYRYLKFVMKGIECYDPSGKNNGNTAQIKEFYLGYSKADTKIYTE